MAATGATPVALSGSADSQPVATSRNGIYHGFSVRETAGVTAVLRIREASASGRILDTISLAANESAREFYELGVSFQGGLYEDWVSGAYEGVVRVEAF